MPVRMNECAKSNYICEKFTTLRQGAGKHRFAEWISVGKKNQVGKLCLIFWSKEYHHVCYTLREKLSKSTFKDKKSTETKWC